MKTTLDHNRIILLIQRKKIIIIKMQKKPKDENNTCLHNMQLYLKYVKSLVLHNQLN